MFENCVILAGGKSSRMGKDKTLLPFNNFPTLTHFQAHKLSSIFKNVYVSSKFQKFNPPLNIIADKSDDFSPMLALYSVLGNFKNHVFIITADMPFVNLKTIEQLHNFIDKFDVVIAKDEFHKHSLCGFFSPILEQTAKKLYQEEKHKIGILLNSCNTKELEFQDSKQFFNINYPNEYEEALNDFSKFNK